MPEVLSQQRDDVLIGQFTSQRILDDMLVAQIGRELLELADRAEGKMLLDFQGVTLMSSAMIGKIVLLNKKCKAGKTDLSVCRQHWASRAQEVPTTLEFSSHSTATGNLR